MGSFLETVIDPGIVIWDCFKLKGRRAKFQHIKIHSAKLTYFYNMDTNAKLK